MALRKRPKASTVEDVEGLSSGVFESGCDGDYDLIKVCN